MFEIEDDWYFDIGYSYAISLSIFIIGLIYSATVPLIPLFTCFYFAIKYIVDKYNLTHVYSYEFESNGTLALSVRKYIAFGVFITQLSMARLFTPIIKSGIEVAALIVVFGEIFFMIVYHNFDVSELKEIINNFDNKARRSTMVEEGEYLLLTDEQENKIDNSNNSMVVGLKLMEVQRHILKNAY